MSLSLRNPHSVLAALQSRPDDVLDVRLRGTAPHGAWADVVRLAAERRIPVVRDMPDERGGRRRPKQAAEVKAGRVGIAEATVRERPDVPLDELFAGVATRDGGQGLWLALDQLQDPHNVGAVFRTASFFGVAGVVLTRDRSAPLNATVYDVASGGMETVPFGQQTNLSRTLEVAKKSGLWVLGSSEHAESDVFEVARDRPWLLVVGNEEKGLRRLTLENCDQTCRISRRGSVTSLNVSVATGVLLASLQRPC